MAEMTPDDWINEICDLLHAGKTNEAVDTAHSAIIAAVQAEHERAREACAKVAERVGAEEPEFPPGAANRIAAAIRAMPGQDPECGKEEEG